VSPENIFIEPISLEQNFIFQKSKAEQFQQDQTNHVFSDKWERVENNNDVGQLDEFQREWFLKLYGFSSEDDLAAYLNTKKLILDAGCGLGYKSAWFAKLAPYSVIIGMDFSEAAKIAAEKYRGIPNLFFIQGDIAQTGLKLSSVDCVVCDQVIMHTESPEQTFKHLASLLSDAGEFLCYVYAKKALPRELIDDYFRKETLNLSSEELWQMSHQLTELGKQLSELDVKVTVPDIPLLGIKGGEYDIQRFVYWNFLKCFWRPDWSTALCDATNFDWYSPSNAKRYSVNEFLSMGQANGLQVLFKHTEEACHTARFKK
jgi:SAM-dependent methyltransferase